VSEPIAQVSDELLAQISEVSNATVLSALRQRGYHKVYMDGVKPLATGRRLCARAITLRSLPVRPDLAERIATREHGDGFNNTPRWEAVNSVGPGYALVIDAMRLSNVSTGGDVVFSRILTRKGAGIVTDGAIRDGAAVAEYGFPVYAGGSTSIVGEDHILPYSVNEPVQCGGVLVWPGDIIMGDDDGVIVLPSQLAEEILPWAIEHDEMEQAVLEHSIRTGESPAPYYPFNDETKKLWEKWKADRA